MFRYITKDDYFGALDIREIDGTLAPTRDFGLKHVQDAVILNHIRDLPAGGVAEIGGGDSRTLPFLHGKGWNCINVDRFKGAGNGPTQVPENPAYSIVDAYIGDYSPLIPASSLDLVYSISVVEHIPNNALGPFFGDLWRVLKKGGVTIHAIDMYIGDSPEEHNNQRLHLLAETAKAMGFQFLEADSLPVPIFRSCYATNPDLVMRAWNSMVPHIKNVRATNQSCSLLFGLRK